MRLLLNWSERRGSQKLIDGQCAEGFELRIAGAATTSQARIVEVRFAPDSLLEQAGFEPSVPRDTTNFQEAAVCHLCRLPFAPTEESARTREAGSNYTRREKALADCSQKSRERRRYGACRDMTFGGAGSYRGSSSTNAHARLASNLSE
jgi:hypothetical protein